MESLKLYFGGSQYRYKLFLEKIKENNVDYLRTILYYGVSVCQNNNEPLTCAVLSKSYESVCVLLSRGADPFARGGGIFIHSAKIQGADFVRILLHAIVITDFNQKKTYRMSKFHNIYYDALKEAAKVGNLKAIEYLIEAYSIYPDYIHVNYLEKNSSPYDKHVQNIISEAAKNDHVNVVEFFYKNNIDVLFVLDDAAVFECVNVVKFLIEKGAILTDELFLRSITHAWVKTALYFIEIIDRYIIGTEEACKKGENEMINLALIKKFDLN